MTVGHISLIYTNWPQPHNHDFHMQGIHTISLAWEERKSFTPQLPGKKANILLFP